MLRLMALVLVLGTIGVSSDASAHREQVRQRVAAHHSPDAAQHPAAVRASVVSGRKAAGRQQNRAMLVTKTAHTTLPSPPLHAVYTAPLDVAGPAKMTTAAPKAPCTQVLGKSCLPGTLGSGTQCCAKPLACLKGACGVPPPPPCSLKAGATCTAPDDLSKGGKFCCLASTCTKGTTASTCVAAPTK